MDYIGPNYFLLIGVPLMFCGLVVWFLKSKNRLKRLVVVFTAVALLFLGLAMNRMDKVDKEKSEMVYEYSSQNTETEEDLKDMMSYDIPLIAYYSIVGIMAVLITIIEIKNYNIGQKNKGNC